MLCASSFVHFDITLYIYKLINLLIAILIHYSKYSVFDTYKIEFLFAKSLFLLVQF